MVAKQIEQAEFARKVLYLVEVSDRPVTTSEVVDGLQSNMHRTQLCLDILESFALVHKNPANPPTYSPTRRKKTCN